MNMNALRKCRAKLYYALLPLLAACTAAVAAESKTLTGTFEFLNESGRPLQCMYQFLAYDFPYDIDHKIDCGMQHPQYIRISNVPSAATITFIQYPIWFLGCYPPAPMIPMFKITFKTRQATGTSSEPLDINELLRGAALHQMPSQGLEAIAIQRQDGVGTEYDYRKNMGCISIRPGS